MPLKDADIKFVRGEIQKAVQEHLNPHGWRKLQTFLPTVGVLSVFVGLLALAGAGWKYAFSRVEVEAQFQAHTTDALKVTEDRLTRIEGRLALLQAQNTVTKYLTTPSPDLKKHREELAAVKKNLTNLPPDTPNYWQTSFQIITLASKATSDLEKVAQQPKENSYDNVVSDPLGAIGPVDNRRAVLKNLIQGMIFRNSVIRFDRSVRLVNDVFINCVFILPTEENPPKVLQEIGKTLLASDLSNVTINAS